MTLAVSGKISIHFTKGVTITIIKVWGGHGLLSSDTKSLQGQQPWFLFCVLNECNIYCQRPGWKTPPGKARPWQEAYLLLRFEASAWLLPCSSPAKAVMESPHVSALCDGNVCPSAKILLFTHRRGPWAEVLPPRRFEGGLRVRAARGVLE